jgi:hypothetical protein
VKAKVYLVQRVNPDGSEDPTIVAVKLTHLLAHQIARQFAPARVKALVADKTDEVNGEPLEAAAEAAAGVGMALIGISRTDTFEYVSDRDPCKRTIPVRQAEGGPVQLISQVETVVDEGATVFKLGVLDVFLMGQIYDRSTKVTRSIVDNPDGDINVITQVNATNIDAVKFGLKGWQNFKDGGGNDLPFQSVKQFIMGREYEVCADETLRLLGIQLIQELAGKIKEASEVSKVEVKNSVRASSQSA